ncbi:MAG TPA: terminase family protein [Pseudolabrys sp.]|nr:terminase family protein [Pseudolabrys sp.]
MNLGADLARALDPVRFALDCSIDADPWQRDLLTSTTSRAALLCSRQSGKTTVTALIALHCALYAPGSLIIIVSPSQAQSGEMLRSIKALHSMLDGVPEAIGDSVLKFELTNGSRILALPGSAATVRGYAAPALVIVDEAAGVTDDLIQAIFPMLATRDDGRFIMLTTPKGKRGFFYNTWISADPSWKRIKITAKDCPRISQAFLDEQLRLLGPTRFNEEYMCEFLDGEDSAFPTDIIDRAFTTEIKPLWQ